jgi:hypothetical protein
MYNTTISGNAAGRDRGGIIDVFSDPYSFFDVTHSSIAFNTAGRKGGGIASFDRAVSLTNSIVALNQISGGDRRGPDISGTVFSRGVNLIGDSGGATGFSTVDLLDVDPLLGPLQDNGGPTETHALLRGSPAIDAANDLFASAFDQRGVARPQDGDGDTFTQADIGAFELHPAMALATAGSFVLTAGALDITVSTDTTADEGQSTANAAALPATEPPSTSTAHGTSDNVRLPDTKFVDEAFTGYDDHPVDDALFDDLALALIG